MRTMQYVFVLVSQIVLLGLMFTVGAKVVDLSLTRAHATTTCDADR